MHHSFISNPVWDLIILIAARLHWVPMHACTLLFNQKKPAGCCGKSFPVSVRRARQATQPGKVFPNEWRHKTWYRLSKTGQTWTNPNTSWIETWSFVIVSLPRPVLFSTWEQKASTHQCGCSHHHFPTWTKTICHAMPKRLVKSPTSDSLLQIN